MINSSTRYSQMKGKLKESISLNTQQPTKKKISVFSSKQNKNQQNKGLDYQQKKSKMSAYSQLNRNSESCLQNKNANKKPWFKMMDCMIEQQNEFNQSQTKSQVVFDTKLSKYSVKSMTPMIKLQEQDLWSEQLQSTDSKQIHKLKSWQSTLIINQKQQIHYSSPYMHSSSPYCQFSGESKQQKHFNMSKKREIYTTNTSKIDEWLDYSQVRQF